MNKFALRYSLRRVIVLLGVLALLSFHAASVFAVDPTVVRVNGTIIYESPGGYNAGHGIAGVTFDTGTMALNLTGASLESVYANGDLTINLSGNTAIDAITSSIALEVRGNLNIEGANGSALNIAAMTADDRAIELAVGSTLTIGDADNLENLITVSIQQGRNVNTEDHTVVVAGNTYNYTPPVGDPGGDPGATDPLQLSIDGTLVIDETAEPPVTSASGAGWAISPGFMGIYELAVDSGTTLGYITGTGDGELSINPQGGDITIADNEDRLSINFNGNVNIFTAMGDVLGNVNLVGGIYTEGQISIDDRDMTIGTEGAPTLHGILASSLSVGSGNLTIYATGTGLQYYSETPAEGEGMLVESTAGKTLAIETSDIATSNVLYTRVSGGGIIDLSYTTSLGTFIPEASHWPWTDMTGTAQENPEPTVVTCEEGTSVSNKYRMTTAAGNFLLESTAGTLYQLGWNIPDSDDSDVRNGTVRVIAANGFKFTSGGYTDYSIEAGSTVTIELLPDYGYQYVSGGLNGNQTMPDAGKASYTFVMPNNHLHLSAIFEKTDDRISVTSDKISAASIGLPTGEINGNAEFSVANTNVPNESEFNALAGGSSVGGYLDLSLNEVIYKGTTEDAWKTNITDLSEPMTVNLNLAEDLQGHSSYKVLCEHNGEISELSSTYDQGTGVLTFNTDKYSNYAIAYSDSSATSNPQTYDGIWTQVAIGLASLLGLVGLLASEKIASLLKK